MSLFPWTQYVDFCNWLKGPDYPNKDRVIWRLRGFFIASMAGGVCMTQVDGDSMSDTSIDLGPWIAKLVNVICVCIAPNHSEPNVPCKVYCKYGQLLVLSGWWTKWKHIGSVNETLLLTQQFVDFAWGCQFYYLTMILVTQSCTLVALVP